MIVENPEYPSKLGRPVTYTLRRHEDSVNTLTVIFPGQAYFKDAPLMWYSALAAFEAGSDTLALEYDFQSNHTGVDGDSLNQTCEEVITSLEQFLDSRDYSKLIFISKSIGTLIVSRICENHFSQVVGHIFQTPLRPTVEFMRNSSRMLVLVGDRDPAFGHQDMARIQNLKNIALVTFSGADHLLEVKGNFARSLEYLEKVSRETFNFVNLIVNV